ncbi:MAG: gluconate transporter, partial [Flavobacteriaceae bacterium]|nr:gluconate transporter [Flavobacteriaceae bacterium]
PVITNGQFDNVQLACIVIAIASGALGFSHVNDSGFWMVKQFIGLTEKQTFKTWTAMTGIIAFSGLLFVSIIYYLFG